MTLEQTLATIPDWSWPPRRHLELERRAACIAATSPWTRIWIRRVRERAPVGDLRLASTMALGWR